MRDMRTRSGSARRAQSGGRHKLQMRLTIEEKDTWAAWVAARERDHSAERARGGRKIGGSEGAPAQMDTEEAPAQEKERKKQKNEAIRYPGTQGADVCGGCGHRCPEGECRTDAIVGHVRALPASQRWARCEDM